MSNKEVYIVSKEKIEEHIRWRKAADFHLGIIAKYHGREILHPELELLLNNAIQWLKDNPCPLPKPVTIPTEEAIINCYGQYAIDSISGYRDCLKDLNLIKK